MSQPSEGLQRSQRALSQAHLSSSFTPLSSDDRPTTSSRRARSSSLSNARARSSDSKAKEAWPFDSTFTARGFEVHSDPFQAWLGHEAGGKLPEDVAPREEKHDEWWERLGASASRLGGWSEGEGSRWGRALPRPSRAPEDSEDSEDEQQEVLYAQAALNGSKRVPRPVESVKLPLGVAVWHDRCEEVENHQSDYDYFRPSSSSTSPFSTPSLSFSHLSAFGSSSSPSSPISTRSMPLHSPPITRQAPTSRKGSIANDQDLDNLTHSFLATQDRFGVFSMVERLIEWPWSSREPTPAFHSSNPHATILTPSSSRPPSAPISRIASSHSLAMDLSTPAQLDEGAWTESGELSAYAAARMMEAEESPSERRKAEGAGPIRETLGALLDSVGLASFV